MGTPLAWHVTLRTIDGRPIAPAVADRRRLAGTIVRVADPHGLVLFHCPDTHVHLAVVCGREAAGEVGRRLSITLSQGEERFEPARFRPVAGGYHLRSLVDYILGNAEHHGSWVDALHEASNLLDLLRLRLTAWRTLGRLQTWLPRWRSSELLPLLGVPRLEPGTDTRLLAESAASAVAVPSLEGRSAEVALARTAALHVGRDLGCTTTQLGELLELTPSAVRKGLARAPRPTLVHAIRLQMGVRERCAARYPGVFVPAAREQVGSDKSSRGSCSR